MITIKLDAKILNFIKTFPGDILYLDFEKNSGKIELSNADKAVFYSGKASHVSNSGSNKGTG